MPAGFKPIDTTTSKWRDGGTPPTEESVKNGLVIQDGKENEFVWIPVPILREMAKLQEGTENYRGVLYNNVYDLCWNSYEWTQEARGEEERSFHQGWLSR